MRCVSTRPGPASPAFALALLLATALPANAAIEIHSVTPAAGTIGTEVSILGAGFSGAGQLEVLFASGASGTAKIKLLAQEDAVIRARIIGGKEGKFDVRISAGPAAGAELANAFTLCAPRVTSIVPPDPIPGGEVLVTGEWFGPKPGTVGLGCSTATIESWSDSEIRFRIPFEAGPGLHHLSIQNAIARTVLAGAVDIQGQGDSCEVPIRSWPAVADMTAAILADPTNAAVPLTALAVELAGAFDAGSDPTQRYRELSLATIEAIGSAADFAAAAALHPAAPDVIVLPPDPAAEALCCSTALLFVGDMDTTPIQACLSAAHLFAAIAAEYPATIAGARRIVFHNKSLSSGSAAPAVRAAGLPPGIALQSAAGHLLRVAGTFVPAAAAPRWQAFHEVCAAAGFALPADDACPDPASELAAGFAAASLAPGQVQALRLELLAQLEAGRKVIVVAHAQGNAVVQAAVEMLRDEAPCAGSLVGILAVGSPISYSSEAKAWAGSLRHLTLKRDVALLATGAPKAKAGNSLSKDPRMNRAAIGSLDWSYLADPKSRAAVLAALGAVRKELPCGPFTGVWKGPYVIKTQAIGPCNAHTIQGTMTLSVQQSGATISGKLALSNMLKVEPFTCDPAGTGTLHAKLEYGDLELGEAVGEYEFDGTFEVKGPGADIDLDAVLCGNQMTGELDTPIIKSSHFELKRVKSKCKH